MVGGGLWVITRNLPNSVETNGTPGLMKGP